MRDTNQIPATLQSMQHQVEVLRERASKDALSGLLNRSTAEMYINQRLSGMGPEELCAFYIIDLDNFKQINDTLGHRAGDQAIRQSARILSGLFRASDIVGRLGGDEFIVFLSGRLTETLVQQKGEEICRQLHLVMGDAPSVILTASVGICVARGQGQQFDQLYQQADQALYKAKRNGKHGFFMGHGEGKQQAEQDVFLPVSTISLSGLLENLDSGVALLEMGSPMRLIYVSPSFCRLVGVDSQSYTMPRPLSSLVHPDDMADLEQTLRVALTPGTSVDHTHRVSADGHNWLWWHVRATRIEYSSPYPVLLVTTTDISRFKESEQRLQSANDRLQSAFEQTTQGLWEVDMATKTVTIFSYSHADYLSETVQGKFPDFFFTNGMVHPNSIAQFQTFAQELLSGQTQGYGNFVIQYQDTGCYGWAAMSYRMLCDEVGRPIKAVGIVEQIPQDFLGREPKILPKRFFPQALIPYLIEGLQANLTRDAVQERWVEGKNLTGQSRNISCVQILQEEERKFFSQEEQRTLGGYFDREKLLEWYGQGERWLSLEYRRVEGSGRIRRISHVINLAQDPLTEDIYLFSYLSSLEPRLKRERELGIQIVRDSITGLYDRATTRALVEHQLGKGGAQECAVAMLQWNGLERLYAQEGSGINQKRYYLAAALSVALGPECVLGQYSRDKLLAFFPEIRGREKVKDRMEEAFSFLRLALADTLELDKLRFVAGVVCARPGQANYVSLTVQAADLCQLWHNAAADTVAFPEKEEDMAWSQLQRAGEEDQIVVGQRQGERPLSEREKDVALRCVSDMLSAVSLDASVGSVLHNIGVSCRADRVYVLTLAENGHVVTMPYEWTAPQKPSIQQAVSGMLVERFPILKRCLAEGAPVFLTRTQPFLPARAKTPEEREPWRFAAFPLLEEENPVGFFCVENPVEPLEHSAVFSLLLPHLVGEQRRFSTQMCAGGENRNLFHSDLPNLRSYMNVIYSLNSDVYSSLGAVCLDIPGLSHINGSLGFEYGSKLLWYVSKTMADLFGQSFLFRTWDAEFVALCPDTTRPVFVGRCSRLRSALQRRYPKDVRLGYTWSEGTFSGKELVNEARAIMRREKVEIPQTEGTGDPAPKKEAPQVRLSRFTVYFQPKICMGSGALLGAEALVRGVDEAGGLVAPERFLGALEKNGGMKDLDLYVISQTLARMDRWREEKLGAVPVSVNLSRYTLFDPALPASVLAIQSRYPLLPEGCLELEVPQEATDRWEALREQMERLRAYGVRFALDHFGVQHGDAGLLEQLRFDTVKLDRSLMPRLADDPRGRMLVRELVGLCRSRNMDCIAQGVETQAQIGILTEAGCTCAQGFYYDPPLPAERFEEKYLRPAQAES